MLDILTLQFMQNAIVGGVFIGILLAVIGVFTVVRGQSLYAEGIAHSSLAGVAVGIVFFDSPLIFAFIAAALASFLITYTKESSSISFDSAIGVIYSLFFGLGIIILSYSDSFRPEISSYLFGSILLITSQKVYLSIATTAVVLGFIYTKFKSLTFMSFDVDAARIRGVSVRAYNYLLNLIAAVVIVLGVELLGAIMITSLMITGPLLAKSLAKNFSEMFYISVLYNIFVILAGIFASYHLNLPTGATIVVISSTIYLASFTFKQFRG